MNNIKGVRTITVHNESKKVVLDFKTFAEAARYFDDLYANAVEDNYAEEVLFPILLAVQNEEYDYIDEDGYAVIEQDATGIFEESCNKAIAEARPRDWEARTAPLVDNDLFVDFEESINEAVGGNYKYYYVVCLNDDTSEIYDTGVRRVDADWCAARGYDPAEEAMTDFWDATGIPYSDDWDDNMWDSLMRYVYEIDEHTYNTKSGLPKTDKEILKYVEDSLTDYEE